MYSITNIQQLKEKQNHFEKDYITIWYDKVNHLIVGKWKAEPTSAEFREGLNSLISAIEHFKTGKLIIDTTYLGVIHPDDQDWSVVEWGQRALKAGYSQTALIISSNIFTQMSVEETMNQFQEENPFSFAYFNNMEDAIDWIKQF